MVKKIDVGGPCGLSAGFVGARLSPAGVLSAAALLSCRKTGKGILAHPINSGERKKKNLIFASWKIQC